MRLAAAVLLSLAVAPAARAADPIFSQSVLHETRIVMDPGDWQALRDNFSTNQYYAANISLDNEVVLQVGIRSRGKGSRSGTKPGLRVDFNRYVRGQEFHAYKSLVLDNLTQDPTFIREALSYAAFESMGIAAPQISFTRLTVNDEYWGLYSIVEDIRKEFLQQRFGQDDGNLFSYEYTYDYRFTFKGDSPTQYVPVPFEPETNEDSLDPKGLITFIQTATEAPDAGYAAAMGAFLDVDRFLTHVAVENALAEDDGIVGAAGMNNFYLYQYEGGNRFVFIPWDKDTTFVSPSWPATQRLDTNVLTRRLTADPAKQAVYLSALRRAATTAVNGRFLGPKLEALYALIRNAALTDAKKAFSNDEFELAIQGLRATLPAREADILAQVPAASAGSAPAVRAVRRSVVR
jgi:spore coat protein CotH